MSVPHTDTSARKNTVLVIRDAVPADYPAIRDVVIASYRQYADRIAQDVFSPYLADVLDLETHARHGRLFAAEIGERIMGFAAFYPDATRQGVGWPAGWASGRALAVHPAARGHGVARALVATGERLTREAGAPVFAFHTASFMTGAIALYEQLGYRRAPEFDFDLAARYSRLGAKPIMSIAYLRRLTCTRAHVDDVYPHCAAGSARPEQSNARTRRASSPAYYLGRPAALWLTALAR